MIKLVLFLALLLALAFGLASVADTPGHLLLQIGETEYRVSLVTGLGALLALTFLLMVLWTTVRLVFRLPSLIGLANRMRRQARGQQAVARGLVAIGTGDGRLALRHAQDADRLLGKEPLALLLRAQASQLAGDAKGADAAFRAMLDRGETASLGLRGLYVEAMRQGDQASARRIAEEALTRAPDAAWTNEALLAFRAAARDWKGAIAIVDQSVSRRLIDRGEGRRERAVLLAAAARDALEASPDEALALALEALRIEPALIPAAELAARRLSAKGDYGKATRLLEAAWKANPHPDLADAYLAVRPGDSALDRLRRAKALRKLAPHARDSRFAVARAAIDAREFGDAREALEGLALEKPSVRACLMMAELEEIESGNQGMVRAWLARASRAPRDPVWVADGIVADDWSPVSPVTGRIGAFEWRDPPQSSETHLRARIDVDRFEPPQLESPDPGIASAPAADAQGSRPAAIDAPLHAGPAEPITAAPVEGAHSAAAAPGSEAVPPADPFRPIIPDDPGPEPGAAPAKTGFRLFR
jgi:HemY protein